MGFKEVCILISAIISIASVIVLLTPNTTDNKVLNVIIKILQVLSLYKKP